ncbi:MAG TPA: hypothetical protein VE954_06980, partial [Oligoflexus sp.]|uniref:hypothetical protein n=1 Tax=Oligoflexus sp. TaxID=1971216 RepID=UPI002D444A97
MNKEQKLETLIAYIDRWLAESPRRSLSLLSRYTGVPYPTLRRVVQKESEPSVETALYLLNFVASLQETLEYFGDNAPIKSFYNKITSGKEIVSDPNVIEKFLKKEACWVTILAATIGATEENVRGLLGSHGIAELNALIEEKFIYEVRPGLFRTNEAHFAAHIESIRVGVSVSRFIADLPPKADSFHRFVTCNVTKEHFERMKRVAQDGFINITADAKDNEGDILVAGTIILTRVLDDE